MDINKRMTKGLVELCAHVCFHTLEFEWKIIFK